MEYIAEEGSDNRCEGKAFVLTGTLENYGRKEAGAIRIHVHPQMANASAAMECLLVLGVSKVSFFRGHQSYRKIH